MSRPGNKMLEITLPVNHWGSSIGFMVLPPPRQTVIPRPLYWYQHITVMATFTCIFCKQFLRLDTQHLLVDVLFTEMMTKSKKDFTGWDRPPQSQSQKPRKCSLLV